MTGGAATLTAPPITAMPVSGGIEKNVFSQAAGAAGSIEASLVSITVKGLFALPLGPLVTALVSVGAVPDVAVEKFQMTLLVDEEQPVCAGPRFALVKPLAKTVWADKFSPVTVTGSGFGLVMVGTTSPLPPG